MADEAVLDASVAVKIFLVEDGSEKALALAASGARFAAPGLVLAEMAHVFLKRLRRNEISRTFARAAIERAKTLFDEFVPVQDLCEQAFPIAAEHGFSAYDALYVALAELKGCPLATADLRLVDRIDRSTLAIDLWIIP